VTRTAHATSTTSPGINVVGHVSGNLGLGVAARNTLFALSRSGMPYTTIDVDVGGGRSGHDETYVERARRKREAPFGVNLFQMNPPEVAGVVEDGPEWLSLDDRVNACVPFWELPRLPVKGVWIPLLEAMDVVLAPSRFVAEAVAASAPRAEVWHYPQTVFLPDGVRADRLRFGLPPDSVVFFMSLDVTSDLARKNPAGALEAFSRAFPSGADGPDVRLAVKLNNADAISWARAGAGRVRALLAGDERIIVFDETMAYRDALALSASCDAYLSLHRAEGLGLNLLEAMSLGRPVIATAYSGNRDYMTAENSCLVGYDLVPVVAEHPAYRPDVVGPGQTWADPHLDEAVESLRAIASDPGLRARLGSRAAADVADSRARFLESDVYRRLAVLSERRAGSQPDAERAMRWNALRRGSLSRRVRRLGGRALRALGLRR